MKIQHKPESPNYKAFLLRCWRHEQRWRFALEDVHTRHKQGFETMPDLLDLLGKWLREAAKQQGELNETSTHNLDDADSVGN